MFVITAMCPMECNVNIKQKNCSDFARDTTRKDIFLLKKNNFLIVIWLDMA